MRSASSSELSGLYAALSRSAMVSESPPMTMKVVSSMTVPS